MTKEGVSLTFNGDVAAATTAAAAAVVVLHRLEIYATTLRISFAKPSGATVNRMKILRGNLRAHVPPANDVTGYSNKQEPHFAGKSYLRARRSRARLAIFRARGTAPKDEELPVN